MSKKKLLIIVLAVVVVATLVGLNLGLSRSSGVDVQADTVQRRDLTEIVSASGRVQPATKVDITAEVTGEIRALFVREGDRVMLNDPLLILDTVQLRADVDQARYMLSEINARLEGYKSSLDQASEDFERMKRLFASGLASENEHNSAMYAYQNAKSSYDASLAQAKQYGARLDQELDNLSKAKIVAPMSGVVTYLDCEVGEIAPAQTGYTTGKTLMTIADLDIYEVEVDVDETEINKVELNQPVDIEVDAFPDTVFAGTVVEIGNTAIQSNSGTESQSTNFLVRVVFTDPVVKLRPGMSATVDITTATGENVLAVSYSAVVMRNYDMDSLQKAHEQDPLSKETSDNAVHAAEIETQDDSTNHGKGDETRKEVKGVFVVCNNQAKFVPIETGIADKRRIQILHGLTESDTVVTGPYRILRTIKDGDEVKVTRVGEVSAGEEGKD
ncbi:MAG TPA: efflux RND transporter periplasmic adaptor subunit [candidate division Zixibacteria bacterium]|nr:efflux RND transporter periplasmic adaptor subunit [candidate division Zixibacteria bacterium]